MENERLKQYIARYNFEFSIMDNNVVPNTILLELNESYLSENQNDFAEKIMKVSEREYPNLNSNQQLSAAMIFYGYRLGALKLKNKCECITRQSGYRDTAIWSYNLDELLDAYSDEGNADSPVSNLIEWITNPESNVEIADEIFEKMVLNIINRLAKSLQPGKQNCCTILFPPISKELSFPDWKALFSKIRVGDAAITVLDYGELYRPEANERNYVCIHQTDRDRDYLIVTAYEIIRGQVASLGSVAFDLNDDDQLFELQTVHKEIVSVDNHKENYVKKEQENIISHWDKIACVYPVHAGFRSFLGKNPVTFHREFYKLVGPIVTEEKSDYSEKTLEENVLTEIREVLSGNRALQVNEIASLLLKETQLQNISLGDIVFITSILEKYRDFIPVLISTENNFELGTEANFARNIDMNDMPTIPANYASFTWKLRVKQQHPIPYFKLDSKKHTLEQMIQSIIIHYDHCTTEDIAADLLFLHGIKKDPSAYYTAKVFMYLTTLPYVEVDSHKEEIQIAENVDSIEYQEIDKTTIRREVIKREPKKTVVKKWGSIFKPEHSSTNKNNAVKTNKTQHQEKKKQNKKQNKKKQNKRSYH